MAKKRRIRWDRVALVFLPVLLLILLIIVLHDDNDADKDSSSLTPEISSAADSDESGVMPAQKSADEYVVVLDPGHGGGDGGCTNVDGTRLEKDDNLRIALAVCDVLQKYPHVRVEMTRTTDEFISLDDRCKLANDINADVFVSLHRNSAESGSGIEIWVNNKNNASDKRLAGYIMELLEDVGISKNRGIREGYRTTFDGDNYAVNRDTNMPSCLVEMGFMTSDTDNTYFDQRLDAYADAIATGIVEYGGDLGIYDAGT